MSDTLEKPGTIISSKPLLLPAVMGVDDKGQPCVALKEKQVWEVIRVMSNGLRGLYLDETDPTAKP